jgi:TM2 domain-containing membrane protein YozV
MNENPTQPPPATTQPTGGKDWLVALLLSIFLGAFAIDRFYLGYVGLGILKLITCGGAGVWAIIDIILIATGKMTDKNGQPLVRK